METPSVEPDPDAASARREWRPGASPGRLALAAATIALAAVGTAVSRGADAALADGDRAQLERRYREWREALLTKDYPRWVAATSPYRTAVTRNLIVSQKLEWPAALFEIPVIPPEVTGLKVVAARERGDTAQVAYFGQVDFGVLEGELPNNILILHFHRDGGSWKYDRSQFINLAADPEVAAEVAAGGVAFLGREPYALTGAVPSPPAPGGPPDYNGPIRLDYRGVRTTV
jgi:hypothetical protein